MKDRDLVEQKLCSIDDSVAEIRRLVMPEPPTRETAELRLAGKTLVIAIAAMLDAALIVWADRNPGAPRTNRELFDSLGTDGWLHPEMVRSCEKMAGLRDVAGHQHLAVDPDPRLASAWAKVTGSSLESWLDNLLAFVRAIRSRLGPPSR